MYNIILLTQYLMLYIFCQLIFWLSFFFPHYCQNNSNFNMHDT